MPIECAPPPTNTTTAGDIGAHPSTKLKLLEAEAIHILRETVAEFNRPVLLYSIGKDASGPGLRS